MFALIVQILLLAVALVLAIPGAFLVCELLAAFPRAATGGQRSDAGTSARPGRIAILMPAHDESAIIGRTLAALRANAPNEARLLVVADNCSDDTAALARAAGAEVTERNDPAARGKGYALDHGVRHLASDPPDVVVILDADCDAGPGTIERLATAVIASARPAQALYFMRPHPDGGMGQQLSAFAFLVRTCVRQRGLDRLAGVSGLSGTGMAFPWAILTSLPLASGHIVEDMAMGVALVERGTAARICPEATVSSSFPAPGAGVEAQNRRWQQGHVHVTLSEAPRLLMLGLRSGSWSRIAFALDLLVPPLMLYLALLAAGWMLTGLAAAAGLGSFGFHLLSAVGMSLGLALVVTWWRYGRDVLSPAALRALPQYVLSRLKLHTSKRETAWVRTERDPAAGPAQRPADPSDT